MRDKLKGRLRYLGWVVQSGVNRGGSRILFRRGCTRLLLFFNTNKPHSFFWQNTSCIRNPQVISEGGGCAPPACALPLDPPLVKIAKFEISYENLKGKFSLPLFVNNLMTGRSKKEWRKLSEKMRLNKRKRNTD